MTRRPVSKLHDYAPARFGRMRAHAADRTLLPGRAVRTSQDRRRADVIPGAGVNGTAESTERAGCTGGSPVAIVSVESPGEDRRCRRAGRESWRQCGIRAGEGG